MIEEAPLLVWQGTAVLTAFFAEDNDAFESTLRPFDDGAHRLADALTLLTVAAGSLEQAQRPKSLATLLRRVPLYGDGLITDVLLPDVPVRREAAVQFAIAVADASGGGSSVPDASEALGNVSVAINSCFELAVSTCRWVADRLDISPEQLVRRIAVGAAPRS